MPKIIRPVSVFLIILLFSAGVAGADNQAKELKTKGIDENTGTIEPEIFAPEELLVQFSSPQDDEKIAKKVEKFYGKDSKKVHKIAIDYSELGLTNTYLLKLSQGEDPKQVKEKYKQDSEVVYAEPNFIMNIEVIPNDPSFSYLWALHNTGQQGTNDADIDAPEAWDLCTGSNDVIVAVIDTGVDYNHPDLAANIWTNTAEIPGNGIDDDGNGYIDDIRGWDFYNSDNNPIDDNGHGTHCAGTIGAVGNNGRGIAGVMWQTRIMPLKFTSSSGSGYTSGAAAAILYADMMGADVISNSWGGSSYSTTLKNAIDTSSALVVCAAGNYASDADVSPFYPASYDSPQVLAVAASTATDTLASFSNYGIISVDVAAPGEYIYSTLRSGSYGYMSGTSMATPHAAGLAGLLNAYSPGISYGDVKTAILDSVDKKASLAGKVATSGRINAYSSLALLRPATLSVTGIVPGSAPNTSPVSVTISGTGFNRTPSVHLAGTDDIPATGVIFVSSTTLTANFDLTGRSIGRYALEVTNPDSTSVTLTDCFEILPPPPPAITEISPSSVGAGENEFDLVITGTSFTTASKIRWNETICDATTFINASHLSTRIPASYIVNPGTINITVFDLTRGTSNIKVFTISPSLSDAVDAPDLTWTTGGNADWFPEDSIWYYGNDAAQSGDIGNSQSNYLRTNVTGPGTIRFWWKVSSESSYDYLNFYIDGVRQTRISGEVSWRQQSYSLAAGTHTLEWRYTKSSSTSRGSDCGWVDFVEFIPPDTTPAGSVTGLHNTTYLQNMITWVWTDPTDTDFSHVMVYLNGVFRTNVTKGIENYTATGLNAGSGYTIGIRTVDSAGNMNITWVNSTATTAPAPSLGDAVDAPALTWTTGGNANWFGQGSTYYADNDAAESGDIGNSQSNYLRTTVTGPGTVRFWWKVSSESSYDYLNFYIDGVRQTRISGEVSWRQQSYSLAAGTHTLEWRYTKSSSTSRGSDCGWVDFVEFIPPDTTPAGSVTGLHNTTYLQNMITWAWTDPTDTDFSHVMVYLNGVFKTNVTKGIQNYTATSLAADTAYTIGTHTVDSAGNINPTWVNFSATTAPAPELGDAVDAPGLTWTTGGNANWFGQGSTYYADNDAAESGDIGNSQSNYLRTTVTGPGTIRFWWKVSSESSYDYLNFYIDGVRQTRISGEVSWRQQSYPLTAGTHTLEWRYTKSSSTSRGSDCGWVDGVELVI